MDDIGQKLSILGLAAFAVLVVVLLACGDDNGNGDGPTVVCGSKYPETEIDFREKEKDFIAYKKIGDKSAMSLSISQAVKLDGRTLFENSIKANLAFPYGATFQKYNYVVCGEDPKGGDSDTRTIRVAVWRETDGQGEAAFKGVSACARRDFIPQNPQGIMINFFSEEADSSMGLGSPQSPCWLNSFNAMDAAIEFKPSAGLLDAISKHYMIAQDAGKSIGEFNTNEPTEWSDTKVRFAGEIIVDVKNCEYWLNNNSGTYRPRGQEDTVQPELQEMANIFSEKLTARPTLLIDVKHEDEAINETKYTPANVAGSRTKIQGAPPVCDNPQ